MLTGAGISELVDQVNQLGAVLAQAQAKPKGNPASKRHDVLQFRDRPMVLFGDASVRFSPTSRHTIASCKSSGGYPKDN